MGATIHTLRPADDAPRCRCADCRAGDALPDHLQGWPGAYQLALLATPAIRRTVAVMNPPLDDWNYPGIRSACTDRCAEFGDPACHELIESGERAIAADGGLITPCGECWRDVGVEPGDEFDENAAVGRLV